MISPLVTIAVPTVARPEMLEQTLRSCLAQTSGDVQLLLSDNGCHPGTRDVLARLNSPRLQYRQNATTVPAVLHWNQCLAEARGKYFVLVSDDDQISPNFVEVLTGLMERHVGSMVALSRCETMNEAGATQSILPCPTWEVRPGVDFVLDWLEGRALMPVPTFISALWRTDVLRKVGGFPSFADGLNSDNASFIAVACQGNVVFGRDALLRYRVFANSYGLSASPERLALSASEFQRYCETDVSIGAVFDKLDVTQRRAIQRGVKRMLAEQYLGRLSNLYLPKLGLPAVFSALKHYEPDWEFVRKLPRFGLSLAVRVGRAWRASHHSR